MPFVAKCLPPATTGILETHPELMAKASKSTISKCGKDTNMLYYQTLKQITYPWRLQLCRLTPNKAPKNGYKKQPVTAPSMPRINAWFQSCFANFQVKSLHVIVDLLQGGARGNNWRIRKIPWRPPFGYTLFTSVCQSQTIQTKSKTCQFYPMELNANPSSTE